MGEWSNEYDCHVLEREMREKMGCVCQEGEGERKGGRGREEEIERESSARPPVVTHRHPDVRKVPGIQYLLTWATCQRWIPTGNGKPGTNSALSSRVMIRPPPLLPPG